MKKTKFQIEYRTLELRIKENTGIGEWLNEKKPIKTLKHGRKAKSIFLYGLEYLARIFLNHEYFSQELKLIFRLFHFKDLEIGDY